MGGGASALGGGGFTSVGGAGAGVSFGVTGGAVEMQAATIMKHNVRPNNRLIVFIGA
jgi:hypothetical protein